MTSSPSWITAPLPPTEEGIIGRCAVRLPGARPGKPGITPGEYSNGASGENHSGNDKPEHEGYLTDPDVLDRLVIEKLEAGAESIRAEGWKWVIIMPVIEREKLRGLKRVYPDREPVTEGQQAEIGALTGRYDALAEEHGEDPPDEIAAEMEQISDHIDALSEGTERWLPEDMARAGAVVGVGYEGRLAVERGLVRPEDEAAGQDLAASGHSSARAKKDASGLSDKLAEELTAHRTAALRMELANRTDIALTAVVQALALPLFFPHESASCLEISLSSVSLSASGDSVEASPAGKALDELHRSWQERLPSAPEGLWDWLLMQESHTRLDLLAYCAGCSVNAVRKRHERPDADRFSHADRLATVIGLDMTHWWQPTAQSYFKHVPKARILDAVMEAVTPEAADNLAGMKKDACAAEAEKRLTGTGWLPAILRAAASPADEADPVAMSAE